MKVFSKEFLNRTGTDSVLLSWVFLRGLALIYFAAFASMAVQVEGLVGSYGILPAIDKLTLIEHFYQQQKFWQMPTIFWINASDTMLNWVCYLGMAVACLLLLDIFTRSSLIVAYVLYLSIVEVGQDFTHFQWDVFLLEIGFLAIFLTWGSGFVILLFRWLLARFMFMGGVVKIASGDTSWANLTALNFHYETQPLPTPLAYYAFHLPEWFHKLCVGGVFFIELVVPFFVFFPRRLRLFACCAFIMLQGIIILTGNYTFFNLLVILLCLFLLEDQDIAKILPQRLILAVQKKATIPGDIANACAGLWASLVILVCATHIWLFHAHMPLTSPLKSLLRTTSKFSVVNNYGPFAVMTTKRNEIIVQGSNDAQHWTDYEFKYKPGDLKRASGWNIPHQPRLDWQMWFAALSPPRKDSWFEKFLNKLLDGSPQVLSLLANNPFPDKPPLYIRALQYHYSYTSLKQRNITQQLWQRQYEGIFWPAYRLSLK
ncbi:MAG: lipase maturation factor family protein [Methyloprofundus sp.]|nr:lipase maturation factor family protein [Methyloprofundus sp.]